MKALSVAMGVVIILTAEQQKKPCMSKWMVAINQANLIEDGNVSKTASTKQDHLRYGKLGAKD